MKRHQVRGIYNRFGRIVIDALTGQAAIAVTILVYAAVALLLLSYVSAQVYTGMLTQEISELKSERGHQRELLNRLTAQYVSATSRSRVAAYCENVLGMVESGEGDLERFAVLGGGNSPNLHEFTPRYTMIPDVNGLTLRNFNKKTGQ